MRGEREQPPDRTSLLIISSSRCRPSFAYIRRIRAHHPASLFALSLVLRPTPFLYIRFSSDCCSLFHDVFLGRKHTCGANAGPLRGASQRERFPLMETRGKNTWRRRRLCYPVNLCNLDQSCLDNNLADNLWRSIFTFFQTRCFCEAWRNRRTSRITRKGIFLFYVDMKCRNAENIFAGHIFLIYPFSLSLFLFLSIFFLYQVTRRSQPACSLLYVYLRCLAKRTLYPLALL